LLEEPTFLKILGTKFLGSHTANSKICRPLILALALDRTEVLFEFSAGSSCPLVSSGCPQLLSPLLRVPLEPSAQKNIKLQEFVPQPCCGCTFNTRVARALTVLLRPGEGRNSLGISREQCLPCLPCQHCHPGVWFSSRETPALTWFHRNV